MLRLHQDITRNILTLPLHLNHLLHAQQFDAVVVFRMTKNFHEEINSILSPGDMQSVDNFWVNEFSDEMPVNVNVLGLIVKEGIVR